MPSIPELVYAALLYKNGEIPANPESKDFVQGTATEDGKLIFSFQRPDDTSVTFTLEIFAFKTDTSAANFSKENALLSGSKTGLSIVGDTIEISEAIPLLSSKPGTVSLRIKVPDECSLEIDGTANFDCKKDDSASDTYTIVEKDGASGIATGAYQVKFTVKKGEEVVYIFSECINVFNGMRTDTWSGLEKDAAKEISQSMISSTVYVRGTGDGWYKSSPYDETAVASDSNSGSFLSPLVSIQKAIDKIIAINDGASEYTIYVDGNFTAASSAALADFSGLSQPLNIKIAGLDPSKKAVIDGNGSARGIVVGASGVKKDVNLALENLVIQNTNTNGRGGGITLYCTAGNSHTIKNCVIKNNHASYGSAIYNEYGLLDLQGCVISGNTADTSGTVYIGQASAILTMSDVRIESNSAKNGGGLFLAYDATAKISDVSVVIRNNSIGSSSRGVGICLWNGRLELSGSAKIDDVVEFPNEHDSITHEVVVAGDLTAISPVATITPCDYTVGRQVLSLASGAATTLAANCGKFELSQAGWKIDEEGKLVLSPDIYVSEGGDDTSGKGSQAKPFATIQKAFDLIQTLNLSTVSYTVHILGTVKGKSELSADTLAQKISITGTTGAKLDGNQCLSWLLTINCSAPVEITNVTLTNSRDGGLYVKNGANVTLGEDAVISKNRNILSGGRGGGVRNEGKFTMKSKAKISENYMTGDKDPGGGVYSNGTFIMEGGEISGNYTSTYYSTGYGGGVCIAGGTFTMTGGTISGNRASSAGAGGGVYVSSSGTFTMSGGTISGNTASKGSGVCAYNSFEMSGAAKIAEDNDVYLAYYNNVIRIAGELTAQSPVATITHYTYAEKSSVISLVSGGTMTQDICDKFAVTPQADGTEWKIAPSGANGVLMPDSALYVSSGGDDTAGDGTKAKPFATLQKAFDTIKDRNDSTASYTIRISGTVVGGCEIRETSAANVLITGTSADTDILDGGGASYVFITFSPLSIEIKNVKITNGSDCISVNNSNATVTLGSGAEVYVTNHTGINAVAGTFILDGGAILDDGAGLNGRPVTFSGKKFIMKSGTIEGRSLGFGGCVSINDSDGEFIMEGGTISGGTATNYGGGGVYINSGKFTMRGGTISGCQSTTTNTSYGGGGVYVKGSNSYFTMSGGEITGNTATTSGGGVYVDNNGTFTMEGGTISGNTATTSGGGVYVKTDGTFTQGGTVSGNSPDNVYQ